MNDKFETANISGETVIKECLEVNGGGGNTTIPMTRRPFPALSKKQKRRDSEIVKEMCYFHDVLNDKDRMVELFFEERNRLSDPVFWEMVRSAWIANGKMGNLAMFKQLFQSKRPFKRFLMTIEEETFFNGLPDPVTAYRAQASVGDCGISWTLNREFVERYAINTGRQFIVERMFPKNRIIAYFNRRNEQEVIIL